MIDDPWDNAGERYARAFPAEPMPPLVHWHYGTWAQMEALLEQAIKRGTPLTAEDLLAAQGLRPAPPGAVT